MDSSGLSHRRPRGVLRQAEQVAPRAHHQRREAGAGLLDHSENGDEERADGVQYNNRGQELAIRRQGG